MSNINLYVLLNVNWNIMCTGFVFFAGDFCPGENIPSMGAVKKSFLNSSVLNVSSCSSSQKHSVWLYSVSNISTLSIYGNHKITPTWINYLLITFYAKLLNTTVSFFNLKKIHNSSKYLWILINLMFTTKPKNITNPHSVGKLIINLYSVGTQLVW